MVLNVFGALFCDVLGIVYFLCIWRKIWGYIFFPGFYEFCVDVLFVVVGGIVGVDDIWFRAYTVYQKDPRVLGEWVSVIERDPVGSLEIARKLTVAETVPDSLTLGFSPQILVAVLAVNYPDNKIKVLTSREVLEGIPPAKHSSRVLEIYREIGLVERIEVTPMAPAKNVSPREIIEEAVERIKKLNPRTLDISGGTQLIAIAATKTRTQLTYTYPEEKTMKIYKI